MTKRPGMGVKIDWLRGDDGSNQRLDSAKNKIISRLTIDDQDDDGLRIDFLDGTAIRIADHGRSCCESRYMQTDDDLDAFLGSVFLGINVADGPNIEREYDVHEQQFLQINTSKGTFTCVTHNEHNGYYGGFSIRVEDPNAGKEEET